MEGSAFCDLAYYGESKEEQIKNKTDFKVLKVIVKKMKEGNYFARF